MSTADTVAQHLTFKRAQKFIMYIGGERWAREVIDAGQCFLMCNWTAYPVNVRFYLARVAGVDALEVRQGWSAMEDSVRVRLADGLIRACEIALEIMDHPPEYRAAS